MEKKKKDIFPVIISLIFGISSIIFCWVPGSLVLGVVGVISGYAQKPKTKISNAGIITGVIGTAMYVIVSAIQIFS